MGGRSPDGVAPGDVWLDAWDERACHWTALHEGEVVGAARLTAHERLEDVLDWPDMAHVAAHLPAPVGYLGRLVIHPDYRAPGLARAFDEARVAEAYRLGLRSLLVTPTKYRVPPLRALGFSYLGAGAVPPEQRTGLRVELHVMALELNEGEAAITVPLDSCARERP